MIEGGSAGAEVIVRDDEQVAANECDDDESWARRRALPERFSLHALRRAARRNVVPDAIEYVLTYGRVLHRTGITFHFLAARDVPAADRRAAWVARLVGTVVLVGLDGQVITVYRNRRALPVIRRKLKYRITLGGATAVADAEEAEDDGQPLTA